MKDPSYTEKELMNVMRRKAGAPSGPHSPTSDIDDNEPNDDPDYFMEARAGSVDSGSGADDPWTSPIQLRTRLDVA